MLKDCFFVGSCGAKNWFAWSFP
uniref:Uncharacterized protein n=1 Tax=Anguilla anguilla TaxID=7936 RepID=A0A0E9V3V6_ANGAN